jgi:hypothetical protein
MLYRPELTAHRGGCRNAQLLQSNASLGSPRNDWVAPKEPLHRAHFVILSAAKNPAIFDFHDPSFEILHFADSVQNDNLTGAKVP